MLCVIFWHQIIFAFSFSYISYFDFRCIPTHIFFTDYTTFEGVRDPVLGSVEGLSVKEFTFMHPLLKINSETVEHLHYAPPHTHQEEIC